MRQEALLLTIGQAAESLQIGRTAMYALLAPRGPIPSLKLGRSRRISAVALQEFVQRGGTEAQVG